MWNHRGIIPLRWGFLILLWKRLVTIFIIHCLTTAERLGGEIKNCTCNAKLVHGTMVNPSIFFIRGKFSPVGFAHVAYSRFFLSSSLIQRCHFEGKDWKSHAATLKWLARVKDLGKWKNHSCPASNNNLPGSLEKIHKKRFKKKPPKFCSVPIVPLMKNFKFQGKRRAK